MKLQMNLARLVAIVVFLCLCKNAIAEPKPTIDSRLKRYEMKVKGRQGWQIGQRIRYGKYETGKVQRSWLKSYDIPFFIRFKGAGEKFSFIQNSPSIAGAEVLCANKFKSREVHLLGEYFFIPLQYENYLAGTVIQKAGAENWSFIIYNPGGDLFKAIKSAGFATNQTDTISINALYGLEKQPKWMKKGMVSGFEMHYQGKAVAAVSLINNGRVWIDEKAPAEIRQVLASICTALLLRRETDD
jgi:hypothetical protein